MNLQKSEQKSDWKPISTSPRDGSRILVSNGKYIEIARWSNARIWDQDDSIFHWVVYDIDDDYLDVYCEDQSCVNVLQDTWHGK